MKKSYALFLLTTELEVFASLQGNLFFCLAHRALHSKCNLLCGLGLLFEHGFCLTTETFLFSIVSSLALSEEGRLACLVLGHFVECVLFAFFVFAIRATSLWYVNLV
jgi:hypothetical protein